MQATLSYGFLTLLISLVILAVIWIIRLTKQNENKLIIKLKQLRVSLGEVYQDEWFPLILEPDTEIYSRGIPETWETRYIISRKDGSWDIYQVTPAGVQSNALIPYNDLIIKMPKDPSDLKLGLVLSPLGMIEPRFIKPKESVKHIVGNRELQEMEQLILAFRAGGATIQTIR